MDQPSFNLMRLRQSQILRNLVKNTFSIDQNKLIQPIFVSEKIKEPTLVPGLTGVYQETLSSVLPSLEQDLKAGVKAVLLFGVPASKSTQTPDFTARVIEVIKRQFGSDLCLMVDVCLCSYTPTGHCGILHESGCQIDHAASVDLIVQFALTYAQAGADVVAPSDMMDDRILKMRSLLNDHHLLQTVIMSYSAKFHSKFYGPFRLAADSAPQAGQGLKDRSTYQIDPAHFTDAYLSSLRDAQQGADILMVKPGLPYLDVLFRLSQLIIKPWAVYEVSGEFAAIECLAEKGLINAPLAHLEAWNSFFRAGAQMVITYGARFAKEYLKSC